MHYNDLSTVSLDVESQWQHRNDECRRTQRGNMPSTMPHNR
jgi:hypothetical protein